jgi:hypothetical protein
MTACVRAAFWLVLLIGGCRQAQEPPVPAQASASLAAAASIVVAADQPQLLDGPGQRSLSVVTTHFMLVRLRVPGDLPAPVTWVTLRLTSPSGARYLERHVPFATDAQIAQVPSRHGIGHPINVSAAVALPGGYALDMPILVGGSNLQRRPQLGAWTIAAVVDDRPDLTAQVTVELRGGP